MEAEKRQCQDCKKGFTIEPEDRGMYDRLDLPVPTRCPRCRWKYLFAFWIFGHFRITNSALSGKRIITVIPESAPFPIYARDEFVSDAWDPTQYGQTYDSSRPFIEQLGKLQAKVPHPHQTGTKNTDCDWADDVWESKDSYLTRSVLGLERVMYGYRLINCKDSVDLTYCFDVERSYDCLYCFKGYNLRHCFDCRDSMDSAFLYDCRNCQNCFMSWNLRNKQYCILNKQYSKEEYLKKISELSLDSFREVEKLRNEFWDHVRRDAVHRQDHNIQTSNSSGNFLFEDKNCHSCLFLEKSQNCRYCARGYGAKDCIDQVSCVAENCGWGALDQFGYGNICNLYTMYCRYSAYLDNCEECEYCFGCVGLRKKKYCILNTQYSKEEYESLIAKIKEDMKRRGEWGEFFPLSTAYAGYNFSLAQLLFPETKEGAEKLGAKWEERVIADHSGISGDDLPDSIDEADDAIAAQRIICPETKLSYNIPERELAFYREHRIPLPRRHFDLRTFRRYHPLALMMDSHPGACSYCGKNIEHYYAPELGFQKIACIECYQKEIA